MSRDSGWLLSRARFLPLFSAFLRPFRRNATVYPPSRLDPLLLTISGFSMCVSSLTAPTLGLHDYIGTPVCARNRGAVSLEDHLVSCRRTGRNTQNQDRRELSTPTWADVWQSAAAVALRCTGSRARATAAEYDGVLASGPVLRPPLYPQPITLEAATGPDSFPSRLALLSTVQLPFIIISHVSESIE